MVSTNPESLAEEVERLEPFLVICDRLDNSDPDGRPAWIELSLEPTRPSRAYLYGRRRELTNPTLDDLIALVDETERLASKGEAEKSR